MPEYYQNVSLDLRDVDELDFSFYYDSKKHRYNILVNHGEFLNVTRREGEVILSFLKILREVLNTADSKDFSSRSDSRDDEISFDFLETDPVLKNVRLPRKTEI